MVDSLLGKQTKQYKQVQALDLICRNWKIKKVETELYYRHTQTQAKLKNESYKTMKMFCKYFRKTNEIQNIHSLITDTYTPKKLKRSFPPVMWAHLLGDRKRIIRQGGRQSQVKGGETF